MQCQVIEFESSQKERVANRQEFLEPLIADMVETASRPLKRSQTFPRQAYIDQTYFEYESQKVLSSGWLCVAHVSQLNTPGSFLAVDVLNEPLVATRDQAGGIHVLSRACPHRGTDILHEVFEVAREGVAKRLVCPYHAWSFAMDGKLSACPEMQEAEGFDKADWRLAEIRSEVWQGFVFVNLDGQAPALQEQYKEFAQIIGPWNTADMEVVIELDWTCDFNWKVLCENWMESYHHMGIHHDTLQLTMPARTTWTDTSHSHFIRCHLPFREEEIEKVRAEREGGPKLPGFKPIAGLSLEEETEWGLYLGLPSFMFLTMRDRVLWYRVEPLSAGRSRVKTMTLVSRDAIADAGYEQALITERKMLSDFHSQDMQVNTALQSGLNSSHAVRGRLSHLEEPVWRIQRYIAARLQDSYPPSEA